MDIVKALQQVGLTEYEAKAYVALLQQPDTNGYEVAKNSGVPRAKIYEALDSLQRKGAITTTNIDKRQVYRALPYNDLLSNFKNSLNRTVADLESELARLTLPQESNMLYTVKGEEQTISRTKAIINAARVRLLLTGYPEELNVLASELKAAHERGVKIHVLSFGDFEYGLDNVYCHPVTGAQYLQVAAFGRWLAVVRDNEEAMLAQIRGPQESLGFLTNNAIVILSLSMWLYHDIQINVLLGAAPPSVVAEAMRVTAPVQDILFWEQDELPAIVPESSWPSAYEILDRARSRLEYNRVIEDFGVYRFEVLGEGGGIYELSVTAPAVTLTEGSTATPDLIISLSSSDFCAMAVGKLPLAAFTSKGRISVKGDLSLASNLQRLLR